MNFEQHEARKLKQEKQSFSYRNKNPSTVFEVNWIYARRKSTAEPYPSTTPYGGKWLIFLPIEKLDFEWGKVKNAILEGKLGLIAKVSTKKKGFYPYNSDNGVICIYTYDYRDLEDVKKIRHELKTLGFLDKIIYKSDEDTRQGRHLWKGDNIILYED